MALRSASGLKLCTPTVIPETIRPKSAGVKKEGGAESGNPFLKENRRMRAATEARAWVVQQ